MNGTSDANTKATTKQSWNMSNLAAIIVSFLILGLMAGVIIAFIWMFCKKNTLAVEARETIQQQWWKWGSMGEKVKKVGKTDNSVF